MIKVPLSKGLVSIVDDDIDVVIIKKKWFAHITNYKTGKVYAARSESVNGKKSMLYLHREILKAKNGELVDHVNGDGLDNRVENLRICNSSQNLWNSWKPKRRIRYQGVGMARVKGGYKYYARIRNEFNGGDIQYLGIFETPEEAAFAYDLAVIKFRGEYGVTNKSKFGRYWE